MNIGFSTFTCPQWPLSEIIKAALHYGYEGIEIRCDAQQQHGVEAWSTKEDRYDVETMFRDHNIDIICLSTGLQFIDEEALDHLEARLALARDIQTRAIRVLCGRPPEPLPKDEIAHRCAANLRLGAEMAQSYGVEIWLETHDVLSRAVDAAAIVREADHWLLGIVFDILNTARMGEAIEQSIAAMGTRLKHVHFHDGKRVPDRVEVTRMGYGDLLIDQTFEALLKAGYDEYLCGEWFRNEYGDDADDALDLYQQEIVDLGKRFNLTLGIA